MDTVKTRAVGAALRKARQRSSLTQVEVAKRLSQPQSLVSKLESGERSFHVSEFFDYAAALDLNPDELLAYIKEGIDDL